MTVSTETSAVVYEGNGLTSTFPFTFPIFARTHLIVTHIASDGTETVLVENTNYTLTWTGARQTGSVNRIQIILGVPTAFPLPTGESLRIERIVPLKQTQDFLNQTKLRGDGIEDGLDYTIQAVQQVDRKATLADHAAAHAPGGTGALPWTTIHGRGVASARPTAAATNAGYIYYSTDAGTLERSNGTIWETYAPSGTTGSGGITAWSTITADSSAVRNNGYFIDAAANPVTLALPSSPVIGTRIAVLAIDTTYAVTVDRNGGYLLGGTTNLTLENAGDGIDLVFTGTSFGWSPASELSTSSDVEDMILAAEENSIVYALIFG